MWVKGWSLFNLQVNLTKSLICEQCMWKDGLPIVWQMTLEDISTPHVNLSRGFLETTSKFSTILHLHMERKRNLPFEEITPSKSLVSFQRKYNWTAGVWLAQCRKCNHGDNKMLDIWSEFSIFYRVDILTFGKDLGSRVAQLNNMVDLPMLSLTNMRSSLSAYISSTSHSVSTKSLHTQPGYITGILPFILWLYKTTQDADRASK